MILTGSRFESLMKLLFGRDWHAIAGRRLGRGAKTMQRWAKAGPPTEAKYAIFKLVENHLAEIGTWYDQLREDLPDL